MVRSKWSTQKRSIQKWSAFWFKMVQKFNSGAKSYFLILEIFLSWRYVSQIDIQVDQKVNNTFDPFHKNPNFGWNKFHFAPLEGNKTKNESKLNLKWIKMRVFFSKTVLSKLKPVPKILNFFDRQGHDKLFVEDDWHLDLATANGDQ